MRQVLLRSINTFSHSSNHTIILGSISDHLTIKQAQTKQTTFTYTLSYIIYFLVHCFCFIFY